MIELYRIIERTVQVIDQEKQTEKQHTEVER